MNEKQAKRVRRAMKLITASPHIALEPKLARAVGGATPKQLRRAMVVSAKSLVKKERLRTPPAIPTSPFPQT